VNGEPDGSLRIDDAALRWRSRRGLLELELLLRPFVGARLASLSPGEKRDYARLLEHDDCDIYDWLMGRDEPDDAALVAIVRSVRAASAG
jgi:antitoxin CptB